MLGWSSTTTWVEVLWCLAPSRGHVVIEEETGLIIVYSEMTGLICDEFLWHSIIIILK